MEREGLVGYEMKLAVEIYRRNSSHVQYNWKVHVTATMHT